VASEILHVKAADPEENGLYELLVLRWFIALAARPLQPGCKVDTALILQGEQGAGKSTFFRELGGDFFGDSEMPLDKDAYLMLRGTWLHEWAELENVLGRHEVSKVKAFLSSTTDRYRPPYGRTTATIPRSAIIVGTTNKEEFLHDPTGSRRFWCIAVGTIDLARLAGWREQLLAEAVSRFRAGERWWLSKEEEAERARVAARFTETDPWEDAVLAYADRQTETTLHEILCDVLDIALARMDRRAQIRVANILRRHGYFPRQRRVDGRRGRYWSRKGGG
jgi:predicted P-loop ATPase